MQIILKDVQLLMSLELQSCLAILKLCSLGVLGCKVWTNVQAAVVRIQEKIRNFLSAKVK